MNYREITIGRSKDCDIYLDDRCAYASNHHACIFFDGNRIMLRDTSSNGTFVNNIRVNHQVVPIQYGDNIMIAGRYPISWSLLNTYFPQFSRDYPKATRLEMPVHQVIGSYSTNVPSVNLSKWNWGAFGLYGLWGFFNGCWWAFLIALFFGWLFPIPNIVFGVNGTRWSWENRHWNSIQEFQSSQSTWAIWGIVVVCLNALLLFGWIGFIFSLSI